MSDKGRVIALGFFDGVHLGHQKVLSAVRDKARELGKESQIVTFWPHPRSVLQQQAYDLRLLTSLQEKEMLFSSLGIDKITVLDFTREFSRLSTEQFLRQYLVEKCGVSHLVIGYDHRIGHDQGETQSQMIETCRRCGIETIRVEELVMDGQTISSTKIRRLLEEAGWEDGYLKITVSNPHTEKTAMPVMVFAEWSKEESYAPIRQLVFTKKISLLPGERTVLKAIIDPYWLMIVDENGTRKPYKGKIALKIGDHGPDERSCSLAGTGFIEISC